MKTRIVLTIVAIAAMPVAASKVVTRTEGAQNATGTPSHVRAHQSAFEIVAARRQADFEAMQTYRPGYPFWRHVFTLPDGSIAYGSAVNGRLLAVFPAKGDWIRQARWTDSRLTHILDGQQLEKKVSDRRDQVASLIERVTGPVLQNSTRGDALIPNVREYGGFLVEWGLI